MITNIFQTKLQRNMEIGSQPFRVNGNLYARDNLACLVSIENFGYFVRADVEYEKLKTHQFCKCMWDCRIYLEIDIDSGLPSFITSALVS